MPHTRRARLLGLAALTPLALAYVLGSPPATMGFGALALAALAGAITWLGALIILRHPVLDELLGIARQVPMLSKVIPAAA